jgi:hypothetical protein
METIKRIYKKIIQNTIKEGSQSDNYLIWTFKTKIIK